MTNANEKRPITADDLYNIAYIEDPQISPDGQWIAYVHLTVSKTENSYSRNIWVSPTDGQKAFQLTRGGKDSAPRWSPDGRTLAFVSSRGDKPQVYLLSVGSMGGEARQLTAMENGAGSHSWSPDGQHIAFLSRMNAVEREKEGKEEKQEAPQDQLETKHRKERKAHDEETRWDPRPMWRIPYRAGTSFVDDRFSQVYIINAHQAEDKEDSKPRRLTHTDADHSPPEWTPDGKSILVSRTADIRADEPWRLNSIYRIDVENGDIVELTDRSHADYSPKASPDGRWVAYLRNPMENFTGTMARLAVLDVEKGITRDLTLEFDRTPTDFIWGSNGTTIYFNAGSWGNTEIYKVSLDSTEVEKVVSGTIEVQAFDVAKDGGLAFAASTPLRPPELFWQAAGADEPLQMTDANTEFLAGVFVRSTHEMRFKSPSGVEIQGWYILPVGFEEGKTYPLALNIHGGPYVMWSSSTRSMWHEWQFHAARGYVVFYCNPRGGDGYGQDFRNPLHKAWGHTAYEDIMSGVDTLLEKGFVDADRMALTGGSYGGYMTGWIIGHTDRFKAAVSQRGVYNLSSFYGTSDVPLLISNEYDTEPWEDHQLLWEHSPLAYAHNVKTPTLLIHAENDFRVPIEQAEQFFAFVHRATDTPIKMLRYPRDGHELSRSGEPKHRVSRLTEMVNWFDTYCMTGKSAE